MKLIVGLGNPEVRYAETRHNIGWRIADELADRVGAGPWKQKFDAEVADPDKSGLDRRKVVLARPLTYMNRSGVAVRQLVDFWKVENEDLLVLVDDLNLELGRIRIRGSGSDGGHNGLASVIEHLGHEAFSRLRVGVGPAPAAEQPAMAGKHAEFVLSPFTQEERPAVAEAVARAADAVECWITEGLEAAMNRFNPASEA
ncbi:MAG TPA: aminoacyl-tRNA hydrolase [Phycisphaerae bacterium]|nr:aminoacyl-tRNA hydrolase [Phycisphaerae bacterium]